LQRPKQPYRAPDALSFQSPSARDWIAEVTSDRAIADAGVFDSAAVRGLLGKCLSKTGRQFSNSDNMGLVGLLSTQLVYHHFMRVRPQAAAPRHRRLVDHYIPAEKCTSR
jgi:asparagine synthase (glutamine-hydrolysing)